MADRGSQRCPLEVGEDGRVELRVFVDRSMVEVFAGGEHYLVKRVYPASREATGVQLFARGGGARLLRLDAWEMRPIWPPEAVTVSYTHRERVLAAFRHEQPDRVPMDLMGNASMLLDEPYLLLRDHLGLTPIPPVRAGQPASYYDERILEHFDIDFRRVFLPVHPEVDVVHHADGSFTDPWKIRYIREGPFVNSVENPLAGISTLEELQEYRWPRPAGNVRDRGAARHREAALRGDRLRHRGAQTR